MSGEDSLNGEDSLSGDDEAATTGATASFSRRDPGQVKYAQRPLVHVVAGVVRDAQERVLLAQRPPGKHLAGGWEFPGGKLELGETRGETLVRELREELGISVTAARPLMQVQHAYPERDILLDVWIVGRYEGVPAGLDGQALRWCPREELATAGLLPADAPIVTALVLPERLSSTVTERYEVREPPLAAPPAHDARREPRLRGAFCGSLAEALCAVADGADFLVTRAAMPDAELAALCAAARVPVFARGIALEYAWQLGATGISD